MIGASPTSSATWYLTAAVVGVAFGLLPWVYTPARHAVTVVHEAGHAVAALLSGRRLQSIRLNSDSSGETVSVGRARGLGVVVTLLCGYPSPSLVGLAGVLAVQHDRAGDWVLALVAVLGVMVLLLRNLFGVLVMACVIALLYAVHHWAGAASASAIVFAGAWFLLVGGLRGACELWLPHAGMDDARALARVTWLPATAWKLLFVLAAAAIGLLAFQQSWPLVASALEGSRSST